MSKKVEVTAKFVLYLADDATDITAEDAGAMVDVCWKDSDSNSCSLPIGARKISVVVTADDDE